MKPIYAAWYVAGETRLLDRLLPAFFATKELAELYARELYPDENPHRRYARIFYVNIEGDNDDDVL